MTSPYVCIQKSLPSKADCSVASVGSFLQCRGHSAICLLQPGEEAEKFHIRSFNVVFMGSGIHFKLS